MVKRTQTRRSRKSKQGGGIWDVVGAIGGLGRHTKKVVPYLGEIGHKVGDLIKIPAVGQAADWAMDKSMHGLGSSRMKAIKYRTKQVKKSGGCACIKKGGALTQPMRWSTT